VEEYNLKNHVRFMGVITDRSELRTYYAASDLFVFPSIYDNSPLVVQEAAAFNVPAILVRGSSAAEAIHDGENGFLTDNDPSSLATLIAQLIKNPSTLRNAGEMARRTIHHPWEDIVDDVYTRYIELIRNHKPV
jgi:glycosyltransferase involved in cell wall biosynthesis